MKIEASFLLSIHSIFIIKLMSRLKIATNKYHKNFDIEINFKFVGLFSLK